MKRESDPIEDLRQADPARARDGMSRPPSDVKARVWGRIQEAIMEDTVRSRGRRPRLVLGLGGLATAAAALVVGAAVWNGGASPEESPGPGIGSCVETYSLATLANREFAFDGTVTAVEGDEVTFAVAEVFAGDIGASVTLTATGMTGAAVTSAGDVMLTHGQRYLVAGDDDFAWSCGFTQPYDATVASQWMEATR